MGRRILERLPSGKEGRNRYLRPVPGQGSARKRSRGWCEATTDDPEVGFIECNLRDGHHGRHRSEDGISWDQQYTIY